MECNEEEAGLHHMIFTCPVIVDYWEEVITTLEVMLDSQGQLEPQSCLLGLFPCSKKKNVGNRFLDLALLLAKRCMHSHEIPCESMGQ